MRLLRSDTKRNCAGNSVILSAETSLCACGLQPSRKNGRSRLFPHLFSFFSLRLKTCSQKRFLEPAGLRTARTANT
jgi:hypothetical protein